MKICILHSENFNDQSNSYLSDLAKCYKYNNWDVYFMALMELKFRNYASYDIVHIHWPELLAGQKIIESAGFLEDLRIFFTKIQKSQIKLVFTMHNREPHKLKKNIYRELYELVMSSCDLIIHHGEYSKSIINVNFQSKSVIIPHLKYDVDRDCNAGDSHNHGEISFYSVIGSVRNFWEVQKICKMQRVLRKNKCQLQFHGKLNVRKYPLRDIRYVADHVRDLFLQFLCDIYLRLHFGWAINTSSKTARELKSVIAKADGLLVVRKSGLNSGLIILGLSNGLSLIGPQTGNMFEILNDTGNLAIDFDKIDNFKSEIEDHLKRTKEIGFANYVYANKQLCRKILAGKYNVEFAKLFE